MSNKVTVQLSPDSAELKYNNGVDLEFTTDKGDVLDHFDSEDAVNHYGIPALLEAIGQKEAAEYFGLVEAE